MQSISYLIDSQLQKYERVMMIRWTHLEFIDVWDLKAYIILFMFLFNVNVFGQVTSNCFRFLWLKYLNVSFFSMFQAQFQPHFLFGTSCANLSNLKYRNNYPIFLHISFLGGAFT